VLPGQPGEYSSCGLAGEPLLSCTRVFRIANLVRCTAGLVCGFSADKAVPDFVAHGIAGRKKRQRKEDPSILMMVLIWTLSPGAGARAHSCEFRRRTNSV
jgi:hypothetical protein